MEHTHSDLSVSSHASGASPKCGTANNALTQFGGSWFFLPEFGWVDFFEASSCAG